MSNNVITQNNHNIGETKHYIFELLCFDIDKSCSFQDDAEALLLSISSNRILFPINPNTTEKNIVSKDKKVTLEAMRVKKGGVTNDYSECFLIRTHFTIDKHEFSENNNELKIVSEFRLELIKFLVKSSGLQKIYITRDDFSRKTLSYMYQRFYSIENLLRSYITKHLSTQVGVSSWLKNAINPEISEKIQNRKNNESSFSIIGESESKTKELVDTRVYVIDFDDIGNIIYDNSFGNLRTDQIFTKIKDSTNLEDLKKSVKKNIDNYFLSFKDISFQEKWEELKKYRNKIAHNSLTTFEETLKVKSTSDIIYDFLIKKDSEILSNDDEEDYKDIEKEEFEKTNYSSHYKEISREEMISELREYQMWCKKVGRNFLGLKNFLHNQIGYKDYHIGKAWDTLEELEKEKIIKIEIWKDPNKFYPDQKQIIINS